MLMLSISRILIYLKEGILNKTIELIPYRLLVSLSTRPMSCPETNFYWNASTRQLTELNQHLEVKPDRVKDLYQLGEMILFKPIIIKPCF